MLSSTQSWMTRPARLVICVPGNLVKSGNPNGRPKAPRFTRTARNANCTCCDLDEGIQRDAIKAMRAGLDSVLQKGVEVPSAIRAQPDLPRSEERRGLEDRQLYNL
jgi:hypothetical protein